MCAVQRKKTLNMQCFQSSIISTFIIPQYVICLINRISAWPVGGIRVLRTANLMEISENVGFFFQNYI